MFLGNSRTTLSGRQRPQIAKNEEASVTNAVALESLIRECWAKVEWGYGRILVRDGANAGWISDMWKDRQKSEIRRFS